MIYILLPAYNEAENIRPLLKDIADEAQTWGLTVQEDSDLLPVHAVVVDDGSQDSTAESAWSFSGPIRLTVLQHEKNQGLAGALHTGIWFILKDAQPDDYLITLDADRTHSPVYMKDLLTKLNEGFEIVVASRYAPGGQEYGVSLPRKILSRGAKFCYQLFFKHIPLRDFSCGYRGVRMRVIQQTVERWGTNLFQTEGFACTGELMLKMLGQTTPDQVAEIPFELHYERKGGQSKMPALRTIIGTLQLLTESRKWR